MLGTVQTLDLSYSSGIRDVSALGNVRELNLTYCVRITDVSILGTVKKLILDNCKTAMKTCHRWVPWRS